ncbi:MAG: tetratricopeptide repeat protein [Planctomycetota bacterium]|jgi:tetratricopeptide (TPR) repeat protein
MKCTNEINYIVHKFKNLFPALLIILLIANIACGKVYQDSKDLSCKTLRSMARVYMAYGEYTKAQPLAEQALTCAKSRGESDSELSMCLIDLGTLYKSQNKLFEAEKMCEQGLKLQEIVLYKSHPYVAYTLRTLASIYLEQGNYIKATNALEKAMNIMLESHTKNDKALAPFWIDIAALLTAKGNYKEAESYYNKAIASINISFGPDHLYTANVLGSVAKLYTLQGRQDEAEELIDRTIAKQESIYGPEHHLIAPSWLTKARICHAKGNYTDSENLFEKALTSVRKSGNIALFAKLEQNVEEIRTNKESISRPVAIAVDKDIPTTR